MSENSSIPRAETPYSEYFCSSPSCDFHVRIGDPGVAGFGDWAIRSDGTTVSHRWVNGRLLCDLCALRRDCVRYSCGISLGQRR